MKMAAEGPLSKVALYDGRLAWLVTGYEEARALLTDSRISANRQNPGFPILVEFAAEFIRRVRNPLLGVDEPEHGPMRRMLIPAFTLKRVARMRPGIQQVVDDLLDTMLEQGSPVDLVSAFALPVPSKVICQLLGVPYEDNAFFEEQSRRMLRGPLAEDVHDARRRLREYLDGLIVAKEAAPGEGLLDELVEEQLKPGFIDRHDLATLIMVLLVAGHETTANMLSLGAFTLLEHPDQLARLRAAPQEAAADTVEELLRYLSIADATPRVATEDIEIAGQTIRAGDGVLFATSTVNRDAAVFPDPEAFDVRRGQRQHLAFGFGIHACLGQNLARAEMEIALSSLFTRIPGLRLAVPAAELPVRGGHSIQGLDTLPVEW
ncbi:cytochrome P450 [Streptomyces sp. RerS4]|uniref:cytochrome P450 n=1 Tax=Streptomyces sp. RerS4 TaxID=2942449 RepID=UPI0032E36258